MSDLFEYAAEIILDMEGPPSDDPRDPGGPTAWGIARKFHPDIPWPPTREQALALYEDAYWTAHRCGEMSWPWALGVYDGAVNQGAGAVIAAQYALGVPTDGKIGPLTLRVMASVGPAVFDDFIARRALAYTRSPGFATYGHGWLTRLARIAREAAQGIPKGDAS